MATDFKITRDFITEGKAAGFSNLSNWLEERDPTSKYPIHERNKDAFQRQIERLDIRTHSDPMRGLVADKFSRWFEGNESDPDGEGQWLAHEWIMRQYRSMTQYFNERKLPTPITYDEAGNRNSVDFYRLFDTEAPVSFTLFPPAVLPELRFIQIQPTMLPELIARSRTVNAESFYTLYLNDTMATQEARTYRVEEGGEIPVVMLDTTDHSVKAYKYGRRLRQTYEQMRRMSMDMVSWAVMYIAARAARDKEDAALNAIVNGDGNSGTSATSVNGSTYDAGAGGALTLKMWLNWRLQAWTRPYIFTTMIAHPTAIVATEMLSVGTANMPPAWFQQLNEQNANRLTMTRTTLDGIRVVDNSTVPTTQIIGIDKRFAMEMLTEANADIIETDRVISRQYNEISLTENVGFGTATVNQNNILAYTA